MDLNQITDEIGTLETEQREVDRNKRNLCEKINKILEFIYTNSKAGHTFNGKKAKFSEFDIWRITDDRLYPANPRQYKIEKKKRVYFYKSYIDSELPDIFNFVLEEYNRIFNKLNQNLTKESSIIDQLQESLNGSI